MEPSMIQVTPQMKILVAVSPADFRKGIDGLAQQVRVVLEDDPFSGHVFVWRNRRRTAIKVLVYDGQGYWLCQKRLSSGRFKYWPSGAGKRSEQLLAHELQLLLSAGDYAAAKAVPEWRRVRVGA
jgi:transposase